MTTFAPSVQEGGDKVAKIMLRYSRYALTSLTTVGFAISGS